MTNSFQEEPSPSNIMTKEDSDEDSGETLAAPEPAWGTTIASAV